VICLAPRAPGDSVRPRRLWGVIVRPLNFPVRRTLRESKRREEFRASASFTSAMKSPATHSVVLRASSIGATGVRVRLQRLRWPSGRAPTRLRSRPMRNPGPTPSSVEAKARSALGVCHLGLPRRRRTRTVPPGGCLLTIAWSGP
jgi:hypothetical protein